MKSVYYETPLWKVLVSTVAYRDPAFHKYVWINSNNTTCSVN